VAVHDPRIEELSRAAEALIAGPPEFLRAFVGEEGARQVRRSILMASLRDQESQGRVGVSVDELAADLEAVLRYRGQPIPDDLRAEIVEVLRQLEGWQAVDGGLAPDRAERDGLRRRVERDYALARPLRVFLPHWDEVQRALRRRYISLSANYFAQAIAALDTLLEEIQYEDTDPLRCHTAWQSLRQALHGINTESRDFARELRALRVDGNHPELLADIADRLGVLHEKFFRVAAEGAAKVRERLERLRDERHDGENVRQLQRVLRAREEEWSVGLGETEEERRERLDAVAHDVERELTIFELFMADHGPGSWREAAKVITLALVELTERIHAAISLRLQQTQAITALLRRAQALAEGDEGATQRARQYLWDASGAVHAALWVQGAPSSDDGVRLERWLEHRGGSPLPLVDEEIWRKSIRPRHKPAPPPPPAPLLVADDWDAGDDPRVRELEQARARLVEKLIASGSAGAVERLDSLDELRLLASFLWLPRDSAPLRRLGLRIQSPGAGMPARAVLYGPGFEAELDNYRFSATTAARQKDADTRRVAADAAARLSAIASGEVEAVPKRPLVAAAAPSGTTPKVLEQSPSTIPLEDLEDGDEPEGSQITRPLPTFSLGTSYATHPLPEGHPMHPAVQQSERPPAQPPRPPDQEKPRGRGWPFSGILGRRNAE
jgi:hypothetical protein